MDLSQLTVDKIKGAFPDAIVGVKDFRGVSPKAFDGKGNYTLGIKEQIIFPEINFENIEKIGQGLKQSEPIVAALAAGAAGTRTFEATEDVFALLLPRAIEEKMLRAFHNLVMNAVEAMPQGGEIRVLLATENENDSAASPTSCAAKGWSSRGARCTGPNPARPPAGRSTLRKV